MPTGDLVPGSDGHPAIVVGPWAKDKLDYIGRYCATFNAGMKYKWNTRTYIDLFSGSGRCAIQGRRNEEIDGSPLIALKGRVPFTHYFFNDIEAQAIDALKSRAKPFTSANITFFSKDCNEAIDDLLQRLPPSSLDFCFIDPTNWQIKFDSIRRLTKDRRMDLAITFQLGEMKRCAELAPKQLNDFFGDPYWHDEYMAGSTKSGALLGAYKRRLESLGYEQKNMHDFILIKTTKRVPLYHLLFASKNPRGTDFWAKSSQKSSTGQLRLLREK